MYLLSFVYSSKATNSRQFNELLLIILGQMDKKSNNKGLLWSYFVWIQYIQYIGANKNIF